MVTDLDRWVFSLSLRQIWASSLQQFPRKSMLMSQKQLSQYDRCKTQRPKEFKECRPFQIYQSALGFLWRNWTAGKPRRAAAVSKALIGDHIEKAVFVTLASICLETVGGMKLKFGEEIEKKKPSIKSRRHSGEIFSIVALIPVWSGGGRGWQPLSCKPCLPFLS